MFLKNDNFKVWPEMKSSVNQYKQQDLRNSIDLIKSILLIFFSEF